MESAAKRRGAHTDSESNSFDKRDDMSEDDLTVIGGKDDDLVTVGESDSSGERGGKRGKKRRKGVKINVKTERGSQLKSKVWDVFEKVSVPDPLNKGEKILKAKCKYCISSKLCGQQLKNEMDARLCIALHL